MTTTMSGTPAEYQYGERTYTSLQSIVHNPTHLLRNSSVSGMNRGSSGQGLDILSASQYPQALMQPYVGTATVSSPRKRKATPPSQLYGGLLLSGAATATTTTHNPSSSSSSSEETEQVAGPETKKRRSTKQAAVPAVLDPENAADAKKQRGRPRLDTQDENAADRRRTQIRLAQRAYRHRKETTISALKGKVAALQDTIDQMNKTFLDLHDNMVDAGILTSHHTLGQQLKSAIEEFVALSKITASESDDEDERIARITKDDIEPDEVAASVKTSRVRGATKPSGQQGSRKSSSRTTRKAEARRTSFDQSRDDVEADADELSLISMDKYMPKEDPILAAISQTSFVDTSNLHGLNELMQYNAQMTDNVPTFSYPDLTDQMTIERPMTPAHPTKASYTYSFQETTFARRLHRMCLERAYRNLNNPHIDPAYIKRAFRFTFCFSNRKRMLQRFQEMLKRRAGESLENWNAPYFHIGGAGTHYPRRDEEGNPIFPPNMVSPAKAFGPRPWIEVETPRLEATTQEMLENIGFGGEWYDAHDVEQYLRSKGIYLDGQSSFVEVDPSVLLLINAKTGNKGSSPSDGSSSSRSPNAPSIQTPTPLLDNVADPFIAGDMTDLYANPPSLFPPNTASNSIADTPTGGTGNKSDVIDLLFGGDMTSNAAMAPWPTDTGSSFTPASFFGDMFTRHQRRMPITFDVEMFLERMIDSSACLGRAPGFRKDAIHEALRVSMQDSF